MSESESVHSIIDVSSSILPGDDDPEWPGKIEPFALKVLKRLKIGPWELSIHFCGDEEIRTLNSKYRNNDTPTDVLSFSQEGLFPGENAPGEIYTAGDIIISVETVQRNSRELNIPLEIEIYRLIIHGILHLNGMEHKHVNIENYEKNDMIALQEKLLSELTEEMV